LYKTLLFSFIFVKKIMTKKKNKFYVVWCGHKAGIYDSWDDCASQIKGFPNAMYKGFETLPQAEKAFSEKPEKHIYAEANKKKQQSLMADFTDKPILNSISVDAACSVNKGIMEYQGVLTHNKQLLFKQGPYKDATNNIGEFLALVHALAYCKQKKIDLPIYSDSATAMSWVKKKKAATKQELTELNKDTFDLIQRAEAWLASNTWTNKILKWQTEQWGEIPADFGRK